MKIVELNNKPGVNVILGQAHFIKTVEDIYEVLVESVPGISFGLAFCEASGDRLIRKEGTDENLIKEAVRMAKMIGAGHVFVLVLQGAYPINIMPKLKQVAEVVTIFAATANPLKIVVGEAGDGSRGVLGVIDGGSPMGVEKVSDVSKRKKFLRKIGYKL